MSAPRNRPLVGVSACLVGEPVRYDGETKRDDWIAEVLAGEVELRPLCPEVGAGMPVPRPPIRCVAASDGSTAMRVVLVDDGRDVTDDLNAFAARTLARLDLAQLDGFVFKARSPSCGLRDTPLFDGHEQGAAIVSEGAGLWAARVRAEAPDLPVADEGDLLGEGGRAAFLARVRARFLARKIST